MQNGSYAPSHGEIDTTECAFCDHKAIARYILEETANFLIVTDHAPLVEGHILIIPKRHYVCYGTVPAELDAELLSIKQRVQQFLSQFYAPVVYWEHGVFRQTVFHAHLHCFPFGETAYDLSEGLHNLVVHSQEDIRRWYAAHGHYFYMEDAHAALLFEPEMERYLHIIRDVLWHGVVSRNGAQATWRSQQERQAHGHPLIAATIEKWHVFQQLQQEIGGSIDTTTT